MFVRTNSDGKDTADRRATKQKICLQQSSFFCVCQSAVALFRFDKNGANQFSRANRTDSTVNNTY